MAELKEVKMANTAAEHKTARYNEKMAALFAERNKHDVDSPEREAAAQAILSLWVSEGE